MFSILEGKEPSQSSVTPKMSSAAQGAVVTPSGRPGTGQTPDAVVKSLQMMMETFFLRIEKVEELFGRVVALEKAVANIAQRQSAPGMGADGAKIQHSEREIADISNTVRSLTQSQQSHTQTLKNQERQLRDITRGLDGTPDYDIRQAFECPHCGSRGHVSEYVTCTECGEGMWWGWWPE